MPEKNNHTLSSVTKPDLENDQFFPKTPAKPPTKWTLLIALLDDVAIIILIGFLLYYFIVPRFSN